MDPSVSNGKTGTLWTAIFHVCCVGLGFGALAAPHAVGMLGWVAGPLMVVLFWLVAITMSAVICSVYEVDGVCSGRYYDCVKHILGPRNAAAAAFIQLLNMWLLGITFVITASTSLQTVARLACSLQGTPEGECWDSLWKLTLIFGTACLPVSFIRDLERSWAVSLVGAAFSIAYATITVALGLRYSGNRLGRVGGIRTTQAGKAFGSLAAISTIQLSSGYPMVLLEIQDTLRSPPSPQRTMTRAATAGISLAFCFYGASGFAGYAALGDSVPPIVLSGFPDAPRWLLLMANMLVVLQQLPVFNLFLQPFVATVDGWIALGLARSRARRHARPPPHAVRLAAEPAEPKGPRGPAGGGGAPDASIAGSASSSESLKVEGASPASPDPPELAAVGPSPKGSAGPLDALGDGSPPGRARGSGDAPPGLAAGVEEAELGAPDDGAGPPAASLRASLRRQLRIIALRLLFVASTTIVACVLPFFGAMTGLVGSLSFFPLSIYFPLHLWRRAHAPPPGAKLTASYALEAVMFLLCIGTTAGSLRSVIVNASNYVIFGG